MAITLLGKVLGLYRDHLMAVHYGTTGMEAKAFYIASRIPRVFFDVVFASAIAACFIPVFSEYLTKKGKKEAFRFGGNFLSVMALLTAVLTVLGMVFAQPLVTLFADGYDAETAALAASLTRAMFPTVLFTGVAFSLSLIHILLGGKGQDHADAHVEGVVHITLGDAALLLNEVENGQAGEGVQLDLGGEALGHHAGHVLIETAAGDVADGVDVHTLLQQGLNGLDIDAGGGEQGLAQALAAQLVHGGGEVGVLHVKDLAHQGEAVGVDTGGSKTDEHITLSQVLAVDDLLLVYDTPGEAGHIVVLIGHEAGVLGGLTAVSYTHLSRPLDGLSGGSQRKGQVPLLAVRTLP